jgi:hypothetical protein
MIDPRLSHRQIHKCDYYGVVSDQLNVALQAHKPAFSSARGAAGCFLFEAMVIVMGFWVWKFLPKRRLRAHELGNIDKFM